MDYDEQGGELVCYSRKAILLSMGVYGILYAIKQDARKAYHCKRHDDRRNFDFSRGWRAPLALTAFTLRERLG